MHPLEPGDPEEIGPYRPLARLGTGGMGIVFLARSRGGRAVAVKVIRPDLADQPGFRDRFAREIASARRVGGAFTCAVIDADAAPQPWLATEYVSGPSLQQAVEAHGPLPPDALHRLAAGLAEALSSIHAAGVVHRDLKPSNVLLAADGPRVIDFGIARPLDETALTATGVFVGSGAYLAPELIVGTEPGPAADVFSLGAVLAFAATGRGPFGTAPAPVLLHRVVHEPPDLAAVPTPALRDLVSACLDKDPRRRPLPRDMAAAPVPAPPPSPVSVAVPGPATWPSGPLNDDIHNRHAELTTLLRRQRPAHGRRRFLALAVAGAGAMIAGGGATAWAVRQRMESGAEQGRRVWSLRTKGEFPQPQIRVGNRFLYVDSGDAVSGDTVSDDTLYAVDIRSGRQLWDTPAGRSPETPPIEVDPSSVVLCDETSIKAVDLTTGMTDALVDLGLGNSHMPRDVLGLRNGVLFTLEAVGSGANALIARTPADGKTRWSLPVELDPGAVFATAGDRLYYIDARHRLRAVNVKDGSIAWEHQGNNEARAVLAAGNIAYLRYESWIQAFDAATGRTLWKYSAPYGVSGPVLSEGSLYGFESGGLPFSIDAETGRQRWKGRTRAGGTSSDPVICSGVMCAGVTTPSSGPRSGEVSEGVFGWDADTGELVWRYPHATGGSTDNWRLCAGDDMLFAALSKDLLAFKFG